MSPRGAAAAAPLLLLLLALSGAPAALAARSRLPGDDGDADIGEVQQPHSGGLKLGFLELELAKPVDPSKGSCEVFGCTGWASDRRCQCDSGCKARKNCCSDYEAKCMQVRPIGMPTNARLLWRFWRLAIPVFLLVLVLTFGSFFALAHLPDFLHNHVGKYLGSEEGSAEVPGYELMLHWFSIKFKEDLLENTWTNPDHKIAECSKALALLTASSVVFLGSSTVFVARAPCITYTALDWVATVFKLLLVTSVLGALVYCSLRPNRVVYWSCIVIYYFWIPALSLPPFTWSCYELKVNCLHKGGVGEWFVDNAARSADCSLAGQTSLMIQIVWILLQPWLIPRLEHMHMVWIWVFGVYLAWSVLWQYVTTEQVYTLGHIFYRVIVLCLALIIALGKKYYMEKGHRLKFIHDQQQRQSSMRIFGILEYMLPEHVIAPMVKNPTSPIADQVNRVSILFVIISDFDKLAHDRTPSELLNFLNVEFTRFDKICERRKVTKIETVAEEYVACVGVLPADKKQCAEMGEDAGHKLQLQRLFEAAEDMLRNQTDEVKLKMGAHTGPIVAGVIGTKLPRYRLFGDTINSAARMMQKGVPGQLQFGEETYKQLPESLQKRVEERGFVDLKGKGKLKAWTFSPAPLDASTPMSSRPTTDSAPKGHRGSLCAALLIEPTEEAEKEVPQEYSRALDVNRFEMALQEVSADGAVEKRWLLSEREGMNEEMEAKYQHWHHEHSISHKMVRRVLTEGMLVAILSCIELVWMARVSIWVYPHALYDKRWRWFVFVLTRGAVLFMVICWAHIADTEAKWLARCPKSSQAVLLACRGIIIWLMFFSYDAIIYSHCETWRADSGFYQTFDPPDDQILVLNYVLFCFVCCSRFAFLFYQSLFFVAFALLIVSAQPFWTTRVHPATAHPEDMKWESMFSFPSAMLFIVQAVVNVCVSYNNEQTSRARFKSQQAVKLTRERTELILGTLMPPLVVQELRDNPGGALPSHQYRHATIAQSDLCGFTQLSSTKTPNEVVAMMSELFGGFDKLTDQYEVYKVETVGDAYIAGMAEAPLTSKNSPINVILFGLDMVRSVDDWARKLGAAVTCRVGVAYGECIGGIVGADMQRYHLFGHLLACMDVLESTAPEGRVQVSSACKEEVDRQLREGLTQKFAETITFVARGHAPLTTSKGEVHDITEVGGPTFLVQSSVELRHLKAPAAV